MKRKRTPAPTPRHGYDYAKIASCSHLSLVEVPGERGKVSTRCGLCGLVIACAPFSDPKALSDQLRQAYGYAGAELFWRRR